MTDIYKPVVRAFVAAALLLATATLVLVTYNTARAAGALAVGACGAFGESFDYHSETEARKTALAKCQGKGCRVVATVERGCAAFAVDYVNACGAHGWGKGTRLGGSQNEALRACYQTGGKECVIRTFFCDGKS